MKILKENVAGLEKEKSNLEFQLSEMREKGSRYILKINVLTYFY
jgi:quinol monooxygenase YgiN